MGNFCQFRSINLNKSVHLEEIPYCPDSCQLFEHIRDLPYAAMLDSAYPHTRSGRYDILVAQPTESSPPQLRADASESDCLAFFADLNSFHRDHYAGIQPASHDIPFSGGLLGYLGYDGGSAMHGIAAAGCAGTAPAQLHAYDWCIVQDHLLRRAVLVSLPQVRLNVRREILLRLKLARKPATREFKLQAPFKSNMSTDEYREGFQEIQAYIQAGDCYQVNLAQRFTSAYSGDPWQAYRTLRALAAAPFSAYVALEKDNAILSLSPERFMSLHGHKVETSPIKGTRPRYADPKQDAKAIRELRESEKDRAENLMIVDLLRNDLGRSCVPGSIHVDRLFEVQSYPTVHHLVSTISGDLQTDRSAWDLLRDSFPGGSITGAPKRRAMEIIAELEPHQRSIYCGSLLYVSADGRMDSNIAIRTFLCNDGEVNCWAGGGIVADSQWEAEYQETYDKVGKLLDALEKLQR